MNEGPSIKAQEDYNAWRISQGFEPVPVQAPKDNTIRRVHFFQLTEAEWDGLQEVAREKGYESTVALLRAIGLGTATVNNGVE